MQSQPRPVPQPQSAAAQQAFADQARHLGMDPDSRWIGGYVDYEWSHLRPVLEAYAVRLQDRRLLELGCNVGASAIVLAWLGARVEAVDVAGPMIGLAEANARRFGEPDAKGIRIGKGRVSFSHLPDTRSLPYPDSRFELVTLNSVLEYIAPEHLAAVQRELDRVLTPGGLILITGTSSRLWPREVHSRRWLLHWLPRPLGRRLAGKRRLEHGIWPWVARGGFGPHYVNLDATDGGRAFLAARAAMQPARSGPAARLLAGTARLLGIGPGLMANSLFCLLRKDAPPADAPI